MDDTLVHLAVPFQSDLNGPPRDWKAEKQQWSCSWAALSGVPALCSWPPKSSPFCLGKAYALSGFVFYAAYVVTILKAVRANRRDVVKEITRASPIVCAWILAAALTIALLHYLGGHAGMISATLPVPLPSAMEHDALGWVGRFVYVGRLKHWSRTGALRIPGAVEMPRAIEVLIRTGG